MKMMSFRWTINNFSPYAILDILSYLVSYHGIEVLLLVFVFSSMMISNPLISLGKVDSLDYAIYQFLIQHPRTSFKFIVRSK